MAAILTRHGRITPNKLHLQPLQRFERSLPNQLWQVDFKGAVEVNRQKIMPFTVLDDHSRYLLAYEPCVNVTMATVVFYCQKQIRCISKDQLKKRIVL